MSSDLLLMGVGSGAAVSPPEEEDVIVGEIRLWSTGTAPSGWQLCDGTALNRTTYSGLFAVIGTTYGVGDGSTTFNVPDMRGRVPGGVGTGAGLTARSLADSVGAEGLPAHTHAVDVPAYDDDAQTDTPGPTAVLAKTGGGELIYEVINDPNTTLESFNTGSTGSGSHGVMQPTLFVNFIIYHGVT